MQHQDWETVILKKKNNDVVKETKLKTNNATLTSSMKPAWKIEQQVDAVDGGKPIQYVSSDVSKQIIGGRIAKKWNQKQLAQYANIPEKDIKDIESCKAVENKLQIAKLKKILNL